MKSFQVLILGSQALFIRLLKLIFETQEDLRIIGETNGIDDALAVVEQHDPQVVLLDLDSRVADSFETIAVLKKAKPAMILVAISVQDPAYYAKAAVQAGADALVAKEALVCDLLPAIRAILRSRSQGKLETAPIQV